MPGTFDSLAGLISDKGILICTRDQGCALVPWTTAQIAATALGVIVLVLGLSLLRAHRGFGIAYLLMVLALAIVGLFSIKGVP